MIEEIAKLLKEKKLSIATAESCTGGLLAHMLTNVSGSSEYYKGGVIAYSNEAKICMLHVRRATLQKYGAVSEQTAYEMADGAKRKFDTSFALSTTGVAGPAASENKPVGLVYIGFANPYGIEVKKYKFNGNRLENKQNFANAALKILLEFLRE
ncbi:MAG: CinA family protein [Thermoplasmata archaeon]|nr:CinA family protein [Thermoplasmata archaeon]